MSAFQIIPYQSAEDAFFNYEEPEKIPVSFWYHFISEKDQFRWLEDDQIKDKVISSQLEVINKMDFDFIKIMSDGFFGHPSLMETNIVTPEDLLNIKEIGPNHTWMDEQVDYINTLMNETDEDIYMLYNIFSPLQYIRFKFEQYDKNFDIFTKLFFENPDCMFYAASVIQKDVITLINRLFDETKIHGIYYSVENIQDNRADLEFHKKYVLPSDISCLQAINNRTDKILMHMCGYMDYKNNLGLYTNYPTTAYNWSIYSDGVSFSAGKRLFDRNPILGGFDNSKNAILFTGTQEQLKTHIFNLLDETGLKGVALGADCTLQGTITPELIKNINNIIKEYMQNNK